MIMLHLHAKHDTQYFCRDCGITASIDCMTDYLFLGSQETKAGGLYIVRRPAWGRGFKRTVFPALGTSVRLAAPPHSSSALPSPSPTLSMYNWAAARGQVSPSLSHWWVCESERNGAV